MTYSNDAFTVSRSSVDDAVATAGRTPHPRLLLSSNEVSRIKRSVQKNRHYKQLFKVIKFYADETLAVPNQNREMIGRRLLGASREILRRVTYLAMTYRLTDDKRYLDRAERELLSAAQFSDWNPSHYLDVAEMALALALGYDWLFNDLSDDTKRIVREAIIEKGFDTYQPLLGSENWNDVCNGGLLIAALAVAEDAPDRSSEVIFNAVNALPYALRNYTENGAHPEGVMYWEYATSFSVLALACLEAACGTDFGLLAAHPEYLKSVEYVEAMHGPTGQFFNYSDSTMTPRRYLSPQSFWMADKLDKPGLANALYDVIEKMKVAPAGRLAIFGLLWLPGKKPSKAEFPLSYQADGKSPVATHRSSWNDPDATFIGLKGGSPSGPHAHMDDGSFIFESDGNRWAIDLGLQDYESIEKRGMKLWSKEQDSDRWTIFRLNCWSHSTLVVNDTLHNVDGRAEFIASSSDASVLDMTPLFRGQLRSAGRGVRILPDRRAIIQDEIRILNDKTTVRWAMLTTATVAINGSKATLTQNGKTLGIEILEPLNAKLEIFQADPPPHEYDSPNPGASLVGFRVRLPACTDARLIVLLTPGSVHSQDPVSLNPLIEWVEPPVDHLPGFGILSKQRRPLFGTAMSPHFNDRGYLELMAKQSAIITPENAMKWAHLRPARSVYDFSVADRIVSFSEANAIKIHGHTLVWHEAIPAWLSDGQYSGDELTRLLLEHIQTVVGRYKGRIAIWDVVNEAVEINGGDQLRDSIFKRIGPDYIDVAFRAAHEIDPAAKLIYNDYGAEEINAKSDAIYSLVRDMLAKNVPVSGVGFQMHIDHNGIDCVSFRNNMRRFADLGLEIYITEMDVRLPVPSDETSLQHQAKIYSDVIQACIDEPACAAVQLWGIADRYSWVPAYFKGMDAGLPFDRQLRPKPAARAIADILTGGHVQ